MERSFEIKPLYLKRNVIRNYLKEMVHVFIIGVLKRLKRIEKKTIVNFKIYGNGIIFPDPVLYCSGKLR